MNGVFIQQSALNDAHQAEVVKANEKAELFFLGARGKIRRLKDKKDKLMRDIGRLISLLNTVSEVITAIDIEALLAVLNENLEESEQGDFDDEDIGVVIAKLMAIFRGLPIRDPDRTLMPAGLTLETQFQELRTSTTVVIQSPMSSSEEEELDNPNRPLRFRGNAPPQRGAQQVLVVTAKGAGPPPPAKAPPINIIPPVPVAVPKPVPRPPPIQQVPVYPWNPQARGEVTAHLGPGIQDPWHAN